MTVAVPAAPARRSTSPLASLTILFAHPRRTGLAASVLPVVAFAVTTGVLLLVAAGAHMFYTDPRAADTSFGSLYGVFTTVALVLLAVPVATLGAASARLTARRRNDRLATLRLLGATTGEVTALTLIEATGLAVLGALLGVGLYGALTPLVGLVSFFGEPIGAAALWAGWIIVGAVVAAVVLIAAASAASSLRRVQLTPLGVRQRTDAAPRRGRALVWGTVALAAVVGVVFAAGTISELLGPMIGVGVLFVAFAGGMALLNLIGTAIVAARGRAIARTATSAARLIAGRELAAHAAQAWRRVSSLAMMAFIAVVGGAGASLVALASPEAADDGSAAAMIELLTDLRTGVLLTLALGFLLLACSVGVTQAASVLEDRELLVGLHRLGMSEREVRRARRMTVMVPLRWAALGGAALGAVMSLPVVGIVVLTAPAALAVIAATLVAGFAVVWLSLLTSIPLLRAATRTP
ncbi:FtsX-like permease family protein [Microbacterium sp.]|uniref:FtsX-like permease family protein n=1 Tax=Microbacterium sp. TaxID=51671 RepID=UPI0039E64DEE